MAKIILISVFFTASMAAAAAQTGIFNRKTFYAAMASENLALVSSQQQLANASALRGFEGALMMKKAGLVRGVYEKYALFKKGHKLLDEAIKKDEANAELRFLRLMVQEHAPFMLNYSSDIESDAAVIYRGYHQLSPETREFIAEYSKSSKTLKNAGLEKL